MNIESTLENSPREIFGGSSDQLHHTYPYILEWQLCSGNEVCLLIKQKRTL